MSLLHCVFNFAEHYVTKDGQKGDSVVSTVEEESLFEAAYPEIVAVYKLQKLEIKGKPKKGQCLILTAISATHKCCRSSTCSVLLYLVQISMRILYSPQWVYSCFFSLHILSFKAETSGINHSMSTNVTKC